MTSNFFIQAGAEVDFPQASQKDSKTPALIPDILDQLSATFPIGCAPNFHRYEDAMDTLFNCLPPMPRAWSLLETYIENAAGIVQPMRRDHLIEDFLTPIYNVQKERKDHAAMVQTQMSPHKLAVLFMVFAAGANSDYTQEPDNEEAEGYYQYACAALTLRSIFDSPMTETVQALLLLSFYRFTSGGRCSRDSGWTLIGLTFKLALSVSTWMCTSYVALNNLSPPARNAWVSFRK